VKQLFIFTICSTINLAIAQQSNHLVVQAYDELVNTQVETYSQALRKTVYYDIDFNYPEIKINNIKSKRTTYEIHDTVTPELNVFPGKLSQGYHTVSNVKGELLAFVFNNILFNQNGDSLDYITQYGGKKGISSFVKNNDTFVLFYIGSKIEKNASSFEQELYFRTGQFNSPYSNDSFFLFEATYVGNKRVSKKRIKGFAKFGDPTLLQSNVVVFTRKNKETRLQFVWDKYLYDVNISKKFEISMVNILKENYINRNRKGNKIWFEYSTADAMPTELVVSPSGHWTVFNWAYSHFDTRTSSNTFSITKVFLIDNEKNLNVIEIMKDSGNTEINDFTGWKSATFTKNDSIIIIPETKTKIVPSPVFNCQFVYGIWEIIISGSSLKKTYCNIQIDPAYKPDNETRPKLKDFILAPNGKNYVFIEKCLNVKNAVGDSTLFRKFFIAELKKNGANFIVLNPLGVLEGVNIGNKTLRNQGIDKIYFPTTPTPYHYINFTNKSICNDLTHEFTNETDTNWFDHFQWFWGDGDSTKSVKSQTKIRHQYSKPGKYKVLLKSITADGGWVWYSDSVEILPEPIAKYHTKNTVGCQWIAVEFSDSSILQKKSHTWKWDFGDGTDTSLTSPGNIMPKNKSIKHTYTTSGKFNVQLQVSDGRCVDTFKATQNISILPAPRPGIAIDKTTGCSPLNVEFGRLFTDPTDSTVYHFKPSLVPNNRFDQAINKVLIQQSGKFILYQKLYGPSGCITQDSVPLKITPGIAAGNKPQLKRSTVLNNTTIRTEWKPVPYAKNYQVYRNGQLHAVVNDTMFMDYLSAEIDQSHTYEIQAKDSCDNLGGLKSNIGKTIFLKVTEVEPASKSDFPTALLTWTPYEDWTTNGGVKRHESFGTYDIETSNWQPLNNQKDTQFSDKDFVQPKKFQKCYIVKAQSSDLAYESQSNSYCLGYQVTLFAPSAFTPNGDGLNDEFEIFNYGFDHFTLSIFNSWGQKIHEQEGSSAIWKPAVDIPQGVYVYTVKASRENKEYTFSSTVTLLK